MENLPKRIDEDKKKIAIQQCVLGNYETAIAIAYGEGMIDGIDLHKAKIKDINKP